MGFQQLEHYIFVRFALYSEYAVGAPIERFDLFIDATVERGVRFKRDSKVRAKINPFNIFSIELKLC